MVSPQKKIGCSNIKQSFPSFFKILHDDTASNLQLPPMFVKKHLLEGRFPENPVLKTHSGQKWRVKTEINGEKYCFGKGWLDFVIETRTEAGDILAFWLIDSSTFQVSIFGPNGCEKNLSFATPTTCTQCGQIDVDDDDDDDYGDEERKIESINPCIQKVIMKSHLHAMRFPKEFASDREIASERKITLRNKAGKRWPVKMGRLHDRRVSLSGGWVKFRSENKLMEGDICSFQYFPGDGSRSRFIQFELVKKVARKRGTPPLNKPIN